MKNKLKIFGVGILVALRSCFGVALFVVAIWGGLIVKDESGYLAVIAFLASVVLLIYSLKTIYHIGNMFKERAE